MNTEIYLGEPSDKLKAWCQSKYRPKSVLRINAQWENCNAANTSFELNGVSHPYTDFNKDLQIDVGTTVSIVLHGDSSAHVYMVDGVEVGYPIDHPIAPFQMPSSKIVEVKYTPYYT